MRDKIDDLVRCQNSACECSADSGADLATYVDHNSFDPRNPVERGTAPKPAQRFDGSLSLRAKYELGLSDSGF